MREYRNYLFDLYGTLADIRTDEASPSLWRSCCRLLGMQGAAYSSRELRQKYISAIATLDTALRRELPEDAEPEIDLAAVFASFYRDAGVPADAQAVADFARVFRLLSLRRLRLFPGVLPMLDSLRAQGKRVYLLSNAQALFTRPELTLLGLEPKLDGVLLSSEAGRKKPDTAIFHMALELFGLEAAQTVMVGNDDVCDCWGAAKAGLDSVYISTRQSPPIKGALPDNCKRIEKITDLLQRSETR